MGLWWCVPRPRGLSLEPSEASEKGNKREGDGGWNPTLFSFLRGCLPSRGLPGVHWVPVAPGQLWNQTAGLQPQLHTCLQRGFSQFTCVSRFTLQRRTRADLGEMEGTGHTSSQSRAWAVPAGGTPTPAQRQARGDFPGECKAAQTGTRGVG